MGWKLIDKPKTMKAIRSKAKEFAEMDPAPHDRPMSERRLMVYERMLKEGRFRPVTWASAICTETGGLYRVNGKHTSTLLSTIEPFPTDFYITVEEYECDTLEDVAKLYGTFDSTVQTRSSNDIYMSFAATVPELKDLPSKIIQVAVSGMTIHLGGGELSGASVRTAAERAELMLEHPEYVLWLAGILLAKDREGGAGQCGRNSSHIRRAPVSAAMFATWQKAKGPATEFWTAVRDETGARPELPDRRLAKYLSTTTLAGGTGRKMRTASSREVYVKCIHGWNAWRKSETTNLNYHPDADVPTIR